MILEECGTPPVAEGFPGPDGRNIRNVMRTRPRTTCRLFTILNIRLFTHYFVKYLYLNMCACCVWSLGRGGKNISITLIVSRWRKPTQGRRRLKEETWRWIIFIYIFLLHGFKVLNSFLLILLLKRMFVYFFRIISKTTVSIAIRFCEVFLVTRGKSKKKSIGLFVL